jgi:hypothetical protein
VANDGEEEGVARPLRTDGRGGWCHVTSRGRNCEALFLDRRDRAHLLELLAEATTRFKVEVRAYLRRAITIATNLLSIQT